MVGNVAMGQVLLLTPRYPPSGSFRQPPLYRRTSTHHIQKKVHCLIILSLLSIYLKTVHGTRDLPAGVSE